MTKLSILDKACVILAVMLLLCLLPMPYGYYTLVRFASFIIFACLAFANYDETRPGKAIIFGALALLFQPFFKIVLGRSLWNIVDILAAIGLAYMFFKKVRKD